MKDGGQPPVALVVRIDPVASDVLRRKEAGGCVDVGQYNLLASVKAPVIDQRPNLSVNRGSIIDDARGRSR